MSKSTSSGRRISESELTIPTLQAMANKPSGFIRTSELIPALATAFAPSGRDAQIAINRSDTYFSQKVRNMISHRYNQSSFIENGYAEYMKARQGLRITEKGRTYLSSTT